MRLRQADETPHPSQLYIAPHLQLCREGRGLLTRARFDTRYGRSGKRSSWADGFRELHALYLLRERVSRIGIGKGKCTRAR